MAAPFLPVGDSLAERVTALESQLTDHLSELERRVSFLERHAASTARDKGDLPEVLEEDIAVRLLKEEFGQEDELGQENELEFQLENSAWTMTFLLGCSGLDGLSEARMALGAIVNFAVQLAFCVVLNDSHWLDTDLQEDLYGAWRWRMAFGHALGFADPVTGSSLVSRLCRGDKALQTSTSQESLHEAIQGYFSTWGQMLAVCVLFVYTMACCVELRAVLDFGAGVCGLPVGRGTVLVRDKGGWRLLQVSGGRLALGVLVTVARTAVALVLFRSGLMWLVKTVDIESLLLNCVALNFVLELDELVFACFSPLELEKLLEGLEKLKFARALRLRRLLQRLMVLAVFGFSLVAVARQLVPRWGLLRQIDEVYCGGERDFVFGLDALGAMWYMDTPAHNETPDSRMTAKIFENRLGLVEAMTRVDHSQDPGGSALWPKTAALSPQGMTKRLQLQVEDFAKREADACEDGSMETLAYLITGNVSSVCGDLDVEKLCDEADGAALRLRCPSTCGCDSPISGLASHNVAYGCPASCGTKAKKWGRILQLLPCSQESGRAMLRRTGWRRWFRNRRPPGSKDPVWWSCTVWTCEIEGQFCPPGAPGSGSQGYCCLRSKWTQGSCDAPPDAKSCNASGPCPVEGQFCPGGQGHCCIASTWTRGACPAVAPSLQRDLQGWLPWAL